MLNIFKKCLSFKNFNVSSIILALYEDTNYQYIENLLVMPQIDWKQIRTTYKHVRATYKHIITTYEQIRTNYKQLRNTYKQIRTCYKQMRST